MKEGSSYKWIVLGNIMIGTFMAVLDSTVVNTGLPVIMGTLGADINVPEWVLTGYMLSMASILPAAGWLSERFGYKKIYFLSLLVFTAGSFMCGSSSTIEELIFWRVIEGFGCGMLLPVGMAIVSDVFPPEQRGRHWDSGLSLPPLRSLLVLPLVDTWLITWTGTISFTSISR